MSGNNIAYRMIINGTTYNEKFLENHINSKLESSLLPYEISLYKFLKEWFGGGAEILLTTSGSTGKPKIINVSKKDMIESALRTIDFFGLKPHMSALLCLPCDYIAGKMMTVRAIVGQMNLITVEPTGFPLKSINCPVDFAAFTPMQLLNELKIKNNEKLNFLRKTIVGGAPVSKELAVLVQNQPFEVYETYGMTETCSHIALKKMTGKNVQESFFPLKGINISLDSNNCIVIERTDKDIIKTHDVGEIFPDGSFVISGRIDNVINSGGIKIFPEKIEAIISEIIPQKIYVSSVPHHLLGEQVVLVADKPINNIKFLFGELEKYLTKYEMPAALYQIDAFPLNEWGKIRRKLIPHFILFHSESDRLN